MQQSTIRFSRTESAQFFRTLNKRVNAYFKENGIKKTGNWKLYLKSAVMFSLFLAPYFLILTLGLPNWANLLLTILHSAGIEQSHFADSTGLIASLLA